MYGTTIKNYIRIPIKDVFESYLNDHGQHDFLLKKYLISLKSQNCWSVKDMVFQSGIRHIKNLEKKTMGELWILGIGEFNRYWSELMHRIQTWNNIQGVSIKKL